MRDYEPERVVEVDREPLHQRVAVLEKQIRELQSMAQELDARLGKFMAAAGRELDL